MLATGIVFLVSVLSFVATEFFFPVDDDPLSKRQRHFWSIVMFVVSLILGTSIKAGYDTRRYMEGIAAVFRKLSDKEVENGFQSMYISYSGPLFATAHPAIRKWAREAITTLSRELADGYIRIPATRAPEQIGSVYSDAREFIVATNVGGTKAYFDVPLYRQENRKASRRGVPIVRFWIYDSQRSVLLRNDVAPRRVGLDEFEKEVEALHDSLESLASIVVDLNQVKVARVRDVLLMDNAFLAETDLGSDWTLNSAVATAKDESIEDVRRYLVDLYDRGQPVKVFLMKDAEVKTRFDRYRYLGGDRARQALADVIDQMRVK